MDGRRCKVDSGSGFSWGGVEVSSSDPSFLDVAWAVGDSEVARKRWERCTR